MNHFVVVQNNINFELDKKKHVAKVINSPNAEGKVLIPISVIVEDEEFFVTSISSNSFEDNQKIEEIGFSELSKVLTFEPNAFNLSTLKRIFIPSSVNELCDGWCNGTQYLNSIVISPNNTDYIYIDDQYILGKSNPKIECYDIMIFARRDIIVAEIPSFIEIIGSYCFQNCMNLKSVFFTYGSVLKLINNYAFACSSIENISFPIQVKRIRNYAFLNCKNLQINDILNEIEHINIAENSFSGSSIENEIQQMFGANGQIYFEKDIEENIYDLLSHNEKEQLNAICSHFRQLKHITQANYYSLIDSLSNFSVEKANKWSIERCWISGVISSFLEVEYNGHKGTVILPIVIKLKV